jgi:hypothetical protein
MTNPPFTEAKTRAWIAHLRTFKKPTQFAATGLIAWMADQIWPAKYGNRNVVKMRDEINALRAAIRAQGDQAVQAAWNAVEEHIDFAYRNMEGVECPADDLPR